MLGIIGLVFGLVFLVGLIGVAAREIIAVARQTRIAEMHVAFAEARAADDRAAARRLVGQLVTLYRDRPETAHARAEVEDAMRAIIDGRDLIDVAERALLRPLDDRAQGEIAAAAKRVSLVTAISPRAVLDVVFVVAQIVRLVRRIAEIYGGRPGLLGLVKLARSIGAHIAITGGMAVGDSLLQQLVGHGIASRISARMGEGVLNGLLDRARRTVRARRLPAGALFGRQGPRRLRGRAVPVQQRQGGVSPFRDCRGRNRSRRDATARRRVRPVLYVLQAMERPMIAEISSHREELEQLCRRFHVRRLDLFGSASSDDFNPARSDLDFLVEFEPEASSFDIYFGLKESLEALFGRSVDLVESSAIRNPYFKASVEQFSRVRL